MRAGIASRDRTRAPVLQLVPRSSKADSDRCAETAKALRDLAEMAERGQITGLAYVVIEPHRKAAAGRVGSARDDVYLVSYWLQRLNQSLLDK